MNEENKIEHFPELMKCVNCKNFTGVTCSASSQNIQVNKNSECCNGLYDPLDLSIQLKTCYDNIVYILDYYMDLNDDVKNLIALWIIGTYFHDYFNTFSHLHVHAMRGSGKSRLLKIITAFSKDGQLTNSLTDSVLFRTTGTLAIDECEGIMSKEKSSLRELLNSSYKKGTSVFRMRKKKTPEGETQVVEEFKPFRPVVMANISGIEEVLNDRCITVLLEKSLDSSKTKLVENFSDLEIVKNTITTLNTLSQCSLCSVVTEKNIYTRWNEFIKSFYNNTNYTTTLYNIYTYNYIEQHHLIIKKDLNKFFNIINEAGVDGRHLELFFPLFMLAEEIEEEILKKTIEYSKKISYEKKEEEIVESKDVMVYNFISKEQTENWKEIQELTNTFRFVTGEDYEWLNAKWFGRALKRLNLIKKKRRLGKGIQVLLDIEKAKIKSQMFKSKDFMEVTTNEIPT